MSLCAEDLKKMLQRRDLQYRAGVAVCVSPCHLVSDALSAVRDVVDPARSRGLRALWCFLIVGHSLLNQLPLRVMGEAVEVVSASSPAEGDFVFHVLTDDHLDGAVVLVIAGTERHT